MTPSMMLFYVLGGLLVIASLMVVFLSSVVHSAMALVAALFLIAILFLTLHAPMVGVLQVLVYAGAIMVLFLFVIMLLNPAAVHPRRGGFRHRRARSHRPPRSHCGLDVHRADAQRRQSHFYRLRPFFGLHGGTGGGFLRHGGGRG